MITRCNSQCVSIFITALRLEDFGSREGATLISQDKLCSSFASKQKFEQWREKNLIHPVFFKGKKKKRETIPQLKSRTPPHIDRMSRDQLHLHFGQTNPVWCPNFNGAQVALGQFYDYFHEYYSKHPSKYFFFLFLFSCFVNRSLQFVKDTNTIAEGIQMQRLRSAQCCFL